MKAKVDAEACIGCGVCVNICPDVFEMKDDKAVAYVAVVPTEAENSCQEAADSCPVTAIIIE